MFYCGLRPKHQAQVNSSMCVGDCSGYRVEKFDVEKGKWEKVADVQGTKCKVPKLQEGHQYKFRVIAENKNGDSEPLETESPVTAKNPFGDCSLFLFCFYLFLICDVS